MITWQIEELNLPLTFSWRLSRGETTSKTNFIVKCILDDELGLGEVAPNMRFGESPEVIQEAFGRFCEQTGGLEIDSLESLTLFFEESVEGFPNSLRFGLESAYIQLLSKISEKKISDLLGVRAKQGLATSFSVPILEADDLEEFYNFHSLTRFERLKLKIDSSSNSQELVKRILNLHQGQIGIDANEAFVGVADVVNFFEGLDLQKIDFLEQPFKSNESNLGRELKNELPLLLMADESLTSGQVIDDFALDFHAVNIKLMKAGSFIKAKRQLQQARGLGLKVMLGCMIESSIGISYALSMGAEFDWLDLDGFLLIKDEPFKWIYEQGGRLYYSESH